MGARVPLAGEISRFLGPQSSSTPVPACACFVSGEGRGAALPSGFLEGPGFNP